MANNEMKLAAQKELMKRKARAELDRRKSLQSAQPQAPVDKRAEFDAMPEWKKPLQAAVDMGTIALSEGSLGYLPKGIAKLNEAVYGMDYEQNLAAQRKQVEDAQERAGLAGAGMGIASMMVPAAGLFKAGVTATRLPGQVGKYAGPALDAMAFGAIDADGHDRDISTGAGLGLLGGVAGQAVSNVAAKTAGLFNKTPKLPSADDLETASRAAYQRADQAGVTIAPHAMQRLRKDVYDEYANFGYHPELQQGAKVAYGELDRLAQGGNVDLKGLEGLRKITSAGYNPMNPSNNALLGKTSERIDDFLENLSPNDVLTGDPLLASQALKEARKSWSQRSKLKRTDELLEKAGLQAGSTGSGGNIENATRQKIKSLLNNKKLTRGMTKDEIEAAKVAVLGTNSQNLVRLLGKMSPQGNGLMLAIQALAAGASGGATIPLALLGAGAKKTSEKMTERNIGLLKSIIAGGGSKASVMPVKNKLQKAIERNSPAISRATALGLLGYANQ